MHAPHTGIRFYLGAPCVAAHTLITDSHSWPHILSAQNSSKVLKALRAMGWCSVVDLRAQHATFAHDVSAKHVVCVHQIAAAAWLVE